MTEDEKIDLAIIADDKNMDFETLKYSDYLYGKEHLTESVWEYVEVRRAIGHIAFEARYA